MRTGTITRWAAILAAFFVWLAGSDYLPAAQVRTPVFAGRFYPADQSELRHTIARLTTAAEKTPPASVPASNLKALILPHAGYIYSGFTAAHCNRVLKDRRFSKVIVMSPDHRVGIRSAAISAVEAYETPLGHIALHPDAAKLREGSTLFDFSPASDRTEHSLEVVLPFLQTSLGSFQMVPVVIGGGNPRDLAVALEGISDADTLLVASSDLSHYLPYHQAVAWDRSTLELIMQLKPDRLMARQNSACGRAPVAVILHLARKHAWRPVLLNYTNSGDTAGDRTRVVGYAAVAFYETLKTRGESPMEKCYQKEQGTTLLDHARRTITEKLGQEFDPETAARLEEKLQDGCFNTKSGTFVTLTLNGQLRGCIGNMSSTINLRDGVRQNAISAAFRDPRFSPLTTEELSRVHIEISILTEPQPLSHSGGSDLVSKLRPNIDGVIISRGLNRATFLPQVWKQLPRPEDFLGHLCIKARLPADVWRNEVLDVQTYQVVSFEEED